MSYEEFLGLAGFFKRKGISILPISLFIGNGHLQHARTEWQGNHCLNSHLYFIPDNVQLLDAISFAYGCIVAVKDDKPAHDGQSRLHETMEENYENHSDLRDVSVLDYMLCKDDVAEDDN